jgi:hypothetical protein
MVVSDCDEALPLLPLRNIARKPLLARRFLAPTQSGDAPVFSLFDGVVVVILLAPPGPFIIARHEMPGGRPERNSRPKGTLHAVWGVIANDNQLFPSSGHFPHEVSLRDIFHYRLLPGTACQALMSRPVGTKNSANGIPQNSQCPGVRAKGITSRMFCMPVTNMSRRSKPMPKPACGTLPYFRRSAYQP